MVKILYVDDEELNLKLFQYNMSDDYEVFTALNAAEGLEILQQESDIRVIISDMKMPLMNGIEFIKEAKCKFCDKKYFILTGFEITDEIREALDTELILKYFRKPIDAKEIKAAIEGALKSA